MDDDLISKKDLLELTGISYGQLYRWKRKGLLPEEWFIRKSTFTGQETFFPRFKMLSRVDKIKNMKDDVSLDDLAEVFSPNIGEITLGNEELVKRGIITREVLGIYLEFKGGPRELDFNDTLMAYIFGGLITAGDISLDEGKIMLEVLGEGLSKFKDQPCEILLMRKLGVFSCLMFSPPCDMIFDRGVKVINRTNINTAIETLKIKLV